MTATHWIAIAAIITPVMTSWIQFWLKERSEKKKTLPAANPGIDRSTVDKRATTVWSELRRRPLTYATQWLAATFVIQVVLTMYVRQMPLNVNTIFVLLYSLTLAVFVHIPTWRSK